MILIVADTGPINYLIQIGHIDLLAALVDTTVLPASVAVELRHARAPDAVRAWGRRAAGVGSNPLCNRVGERRRPFSGRP